MAVFGEVWVRRRTPMWGIGRRRELPSSLGVLGKFPGRGLGTENRTRRKSRTSNGYWMLRTGRMPKPAGEA